MAVRFLAVSSLVFGLSISAAVAIRHALATGRVPPSACSNLPGDARRSTACARFERRRVWTGGEELRGETQLPLSGGQGSVRIQETAQLSPEGRLLRADVSLTYAGVVSGRGAEHCASVKRFTLDAVGGLVSVIRAGGARETRPVPVDLPWIYPNVRLADGARLATPTAVAIALRASRLGEPLRLISDCQPDPTVMPDQVTVAGENEEWLFLGDDLATFTRETLGRSELSSLRISALGLELRAVPSG